jgi:prophage regulatory protein
LVAERKGEDGGDGIASLVLRTKGNAQHENLEHIGNIADAANLYVTKPEKQMTERILTTKDVLDILTVSRSTLWRMRRRGLFPKPMRISPGRIGWRSSDFWDWVFENYECRCGEDFD